MSLRFFIVEKHAKSITVTIMIKSYHYYNCLLKIQNHILSCCPLLKAKIQLSFWITGKNPWFVKTLRLKKKLHSKCPIAKDSGSSAQSWMLAGSPVIQVWREMYLFPQSWVANIPQIYFYIKSKLTFLSNISLANITGSFTSLSLWTYATCLTCW